ncbi:MAG: PCRF domain-containing protein [Candidatus Nealsonbacteria bacterium]
MSKIVFDLELIKEEYQNTLNQLSDPELVSDWPASNASGSNAGWKKFEELSKKKKHLEKIIEKQKEIEETKKQINENKNILKSEQDLEFITLAETDIVQLENKVKQLENELKELINEDSSDKPKPHSAIIEIRAGTGGDEAALFAGNLYKMYSKYAEIKNWELKVLDSRLTELHGIKEITFELSNTNKKDDIYSEMQHEGGVHRVQRIPETEKSGRVHTSTATVAVLIKPKSTEIKIKPDEIKVDLFRSSGPGGQNVNKRETAVRITHIPSGIVVASQNERNQLLNKENAMSILSARLLEKQQEQADSGVKGKRREQIGKAKRSEKIRTYNFPQDRVTDHRIKKSWHNINDMMEGKIEKMISDIQKNIE